MTVVRGGCDKIAWKWGIYAPSWAGSSTRASARRRLADVVDWFRRRAGKNEASDGGASGPASGLEDETAEELVDRTPQPQEPADGFSEAGVREALRDVRDPEIGRDLISLNMIRNVDIEGSGVTVGVALTTAGCPM